VAPADRCRNPNGYTSLSSTTPSRGRRAAFKVSATSCSRKAGEGGAEGDGRGRPHTPVVGAAPSTSQRLVPLPRFAGEDGGGAGRSMPQRRRIHQPLIHHPIAREEGRLQGFRHLLLPRERGKVAPKATEGGGHARRWPGPPPPPAKGWSPSPASRERIAPPDH